MQNQSHPFTLRFNNIKCTKPLVFFTQSSDLDPQCRSPHLASQSFMIPLTMNTNVIKRESNISYP